MMYSNQTYKNYPSIPVCEKCYYENKGNYRSLKQRLVKVSDEYKKQDDFCLICGVPISGDDSSASDDTHSDNKKDTYHKNRSSQLNSYKTDRHDKVEYNGCINNYVFIVIILVLGVGLAIYLAGKFSSNPDTKGGNLKQMLKELKNKYPSQSNHLWQTALKMTNSSVPHIHSLILLYKERSVTADCFAKDFAKLINKLEKRNEEVTVYKKEDDNIEYGQLLVNYLNILHTSGHLIVLQLQEVPGSIARIFHVLCDETAKNVIPSYFIFTLQDSDYSAESKSLLTRAGSILRKFWSDLVESDLHPLISRVVKNVAEITEESNISC